MTRFWWPNSATRILAIYIMLFHASRLLVAFCRLLRLPTGLLPIDLLSCICLMDLLASIFLQFPLFIQVSFVLYSLFLPRIENMISKFWKLYSRWHWTVIIIARSDDDSHTYNVHTLDEIWLAHMLFLQKKI